MSSKFTEFTLDDRDICHGSLVTMATMIVWVY